MSFVNYNNISVSTTQSDEDGIIFKNYLLGLKRMETRFQYVGIDCVPLNHYAQRSYCKKCVGSYELQNSVKMSVDTYHLDSLPFKSFDLFLCFRVC